MSRSDINVGSLLGISIRVDYSWFFIFLLYTWSLAWSYFPAVFPEWSLAQSIVAGLITSLLFFASVLAHELGHSVIAQKHGIPVNSVTLFIFGGLARITREPDSPGVEFKIAIAGPLTSIALGIFFWLLCLLPSPQFDGVIEIASWLGWTNLVLAAFNLLPGYPLDGGRVLKAIIWKISGDSARSTVWVASIGKAVAFLMILCGIILMFTGFWINGMWLAFIGWFLSSAASGSTRQLSLQKELQQHHVIELMKTDYVKIPAYISIEDMYNEYIKPNRKSYMVVTSGNDTLGLVNMHLLRNIDRPYWSIKTVSEVTTPLNKLRFLSPEDDLITALKIFQEEESDQLPVVKDNEIIGIISYHDLANFLNKKA
jgi:Zn-dependent protease